MRYYYQPNTPPPPQNGEGQQPQNGAYQPPQGGYQPPQGAYQPPQGRYHPPYGAYPPPGGGYYPPPYGAPPVYPPYGVDPAYYQQMQQIRQEKAAKQPIKRAGNALGWGMVLVQVFGMVVAALLLKILNLIFPGVGQDGMVFYEALQYAVYSPLSILLPMWIGLKLCKGKMEDVIPFAKPDWFLWLSCVLSSFFFVFAGNLAGVVAGILSPATEENLNQAMGAQPQTPLELILQVLYVAAIPALVEEIAFRGITLGVLRRWGDRFAIVASAVMFGLLHGNLVQIPFAYFVGLILGYTVVRTGSIVPAIIIHFINNAMSCLLSYFTVNMTESSQGILGLLLYGCWLVLGLLGLCLLKFCFSQKLMDCTKPYAGCLTAGKRNVAFWLSSGMIGAVIIHLLVAVAFATEGVI